MMADEPFGDVTPAIQLRAVFSSQSKNTATCDADRKCALSKPAHRSGNTALKRNRSNGTPEDIPDDTPDTCALSYDGNIGDDDERRRLTMPMSGRPDFGFIGDPVKDFAPGVCSNIPAIDHALIEAAITNCAARDGGAGEPGSIRMSLNRSNDIMFADKVGGRVRRYIAVQKLRWAMLRAFYIAARGFIFDGGPFSVFGCGPSFEPFNFDGRYISSPHRTPHMCGEANKRLNADPDVQQRAGCVEVAVKGGAGHAAPSVSNQAATGTHPADRAAMRSILSLPGRALPFTMSVKWLRDMPKKSPHSAWVRVGSAVAIYLRRVSISENVEHFDRQVKRNVAEMSTLTERQFHE